MKNKICVFVILACLFLSIMPFTSVNAEEIHDVTNGVRISSNYTVEVNDSGKYVYTFTFVLQSDNPNSYGCTLSDSVLWYGDESDGDFEEDIRICSTDNGTHSWVENTIDGVKTLVKTTVVMSYVSEELYYDSTGVNNFVLNLRYSRGSKNFQRYVYFDLDGLIPDAPTSTPTPTPTPTVKPTPTVTPALTAKPTPTVIPTVKPEDVSEPYLSVDVNVYGTNATIYYYTGGMDSVSSYLELQWFMYGKDDTDGIYDTMDRVDFVDGCGTYKGNLSNGEWYRAYLSYTYVDANGKEQTKVVYSDFFQASNNEKNIVIWNLKSLLDWIWTSLFEIPITYEGFTITFKQIFLFSLIAPTLILFFVYLIGLYGAGFLFNRRSADSSGAVNNDVIGPSESPSDEMRGFYDDFD